MLKHLVLEVSAPLLSSFSGTTLWAILLQADTQRKPRRDLHVFEDDITVVAGWVLLQEPPPENSLEEAIALTAISWHCAC